VVCAKVTRWLNRGAVLFDQSRLARAARERLEPEGAAASVEVEDALGHAEARLQHVEDGLAHALGRGARPKTARRPELAPLGLASNDAHTEAYLTDYAAARAAGDIGDEF
jgi:hypothetical protein